MRINPLPTLDMSFLNEEDPGEIEFIDEDTPLYGIIEEFDDEKNNRIKGG